MVRHRWDREPESERKQNKHRQQAPLSPGPKPSPNLIPSALGTSGRARHCRGCHPLPQESPLGDSSLAGSSFFFFFLFF